MIMPMLQPALEQRLGNANATSIGPPEGSSAATANGATANGATANGAMSNGTAPKSAGASAGPAAGNTDHGTESAGAHAAIEGLKHLQAGGDVQAARRGFQDALAAEYAKVQSEGVTDDSAANAEALKRVMLDVSAGMVMPPS